ncbi:TNFRSF11B [Branchiostoma lanceolatum]|uniref:TNFRSF11B protein n=1 Tax=Branchiostoma lanceolatum TaxID=7740 RepID=A0A8J9YRK8_BRALA|nr:TNFRSF11B [Branchiostoma lanceolatum]
MMWQNACTLACVFTISLLVRGVLADDPPPKWRYDDPISGETLYCDWCKPGEYMNRPCTEHSPTECIPCPWEHYTEYYNQELECLLCQQCNLKDHEHEHEALPCTAEQNRQCECDDGYYMLLEFCRPHSECPIGHGVKEKGTPWKNTRCMRCRSGTFSDEDSSTAECTSHTNCTARGECVVQQGNRKRDNLCGACAVNGTATNATQAPPMEDGNTTGYEDSNKSDGTTKAPHPGGSTWGPYWLPYLLLGLVMFIVVIIGIVLAALWGHDPSRRPSRQLPTRHSLTEIFVKRASQSSIVGGAGTSEPLLEGDTTQTRRSSQEKAAWRASHTTAAKRFQRGLSVEEEERTPSLTSDEELSHVKVALSHAEHIAEDIGAEWRALGRKLGFTDGQCDCFQNDFHLQGLKEITYQILRKWVDLKGEDATLGTLGNALVQVEKEDVRSKLFIFEHGGRHNREETSVKQSFQPACF